MMNRRLLLSLLAATFAALAAPAFAQAIPLAQLSAYLNSLATAETDFVQVNADGSRASGKLYLRRPGRMRFEYAGRDAPLVMAGGGQVAVFDGKSNQGPQQYPLSRTPLNLILAPQVDLGQARMVVAHRAEGADTIVTAQDPASPETGRLDLVFGPGPVLRQWVVTDESGGRTQVTLGPLVLGRDYPPSLFSITNEAEKR